MTLIAIAAKQIFTPLEIFEDGLLVIEDQVIRSVGSRRETEVPKGARLIDLSDKILAPGFVDVHVHGGAGHDVMEGTSDALQCVSRLAALHGTTSFFPTTLTAPPPVLLKSLDGIGSAIRRWNSHSSSSELLAQPLGIHMEGPFLSEQRCGVHPKEYLQKPSGPFFEQLAAAAGGSLKILTLAPELEGAAELQAEATRRGIKTAVGHSDATFEQAERAIDAGACHAVHVFNAMRPFSHRDSGVLGAVLTDDRVFAEVIADGVHVSAPALRLLLKTKEVSRVVLVTDGVSATGMPPGQYHLGDIEICVQQDSQSGLLACRNREGKLAGSVLTQDAAIRNMIAHTGVSLCDAVRMASWNPAQLLGIGDRKGCLRAGADADLVVLSRDGTVTGTMAQGIGNFA